MAMVRLLSLILRLCPIVIVLICCLQIELAYANPNDSRPEYIRKRDFYVPHVPNYITELIGTAEHRFTGGRYENELFNYRLYVPSQLDANRAYPLVIWLNGLGQNGTDNAKQLRHLDETFFWLARAKDYDFFLLAPQTRPDNQSGGWYGSEESADDMLTVLMSMLNDVEGKYPIDKKRIYVLGASSGGNAVWVLGERYPGRFAALVPLASTPMMKIDIEALSGAPLWAFHSPIDQSAPSEPAQNLVATLQEHDANAHFTFCTDYPDTMDKTLSHFCFRCAFEDYNVQEWLFSQSLGSDSDVTPGSRRIDGRYVWVLFSRTFRRLGSLLYTALTILAILGVIWVCKLELRRQAEAQPPREPTSSF